MRPDFALSLSFDGITLLHRAAGGWRRVGEVALDAPDLRADLARLRARAAELSPGGLACKIILPNEQIRYMSVETGPFDGDARREMVRRALEGATPYAVEDLVFDMSPDGDLTHVAAVAIETLEEAQSFAAEHHFNPVSFVAVPGDAGFLGEPWFGPSGEVGDGVEIEPDGIAVVVIGDVEWPDAGDEAPQAEPDAPAETAEGAFRSRAAARDLPRDENRRVRAEPGRITLMTEPDPEFEATVADLEEAADAAPDWHDDDVDETGDTRFAQASVTAPVLDIPDAPEEPRENAGFAGFFSRRTRGGGAGAPAPARAARVVQPVAARAAETARFEIPERQKPTDEASRMTVFGARAGDQVGGKPRHLGLILTAALLLFLAAVALWASLFLDDGIAGLFRSREAPQEPPIEIAAPVAEPREVLPAIRPAPRAPQVLADDPGAPRAPASANADEDPVRQAAQSVPNRTATEAPPRLSETDIAVLDALNEAATATPEPRAEPQAEAAATAEPPTEAEAEVRYAVTGIWPDAPEPPETPAIIGLDDLVTTSIDRTDLSQDAVALPEVASLEPEALPSLPSVPSAAGTQFVLDARGLVSPSAEGALNPDGILIYAGLPPVRPARFPDRGAQQAEADAAAEEEIRTRLAALRPRARPDNMAERIERSQLGGLTREEIASTRPRARPPSLQEQAAQVASADTGSEASDDGIATASALAVGTSIRPDARPRDFSAQVQQAVAAAAAVPAASAASAAASAPVTTQPRIPSSASVARQATLNNAINLNRVNLIGVFGTPSNRRALVRLPSGRYQKVKVGDRVDGGRIVAIGDSELRYQKGGRNVTLKIPSG